MNKLSASALSSYLESPRKFYWQYVQRLEPLEQSTQNFDHDKICGQIWSEVVDRFYKGVPEADNIGLTLDSWNTQTTGWVSDKQRDKLTEALQSWTSTYYQTYSPDDGVRSPEGSELFVENERFLGYLDGLSPDRVIHECKSTSRAKQVSEQLWKVQNSLQVKLYAVLAQATGIRIEFAYKDTPYGIFRSEIKEVTPPQLQDWEQQLNKLADHIYSLGDDINNYPCHSDGCCITTKNFVSMCEFQSLCDMGYDENTALAYKHRTNRRTSK